MSKLIALETIRSACNPNKVYVNAGEEIILKKVHDEEFSFVNVVSTNENIIIRSDLIGTADGTEVLINSPEIVKKKAQSNKKPQSKSGNHKQGELF
jgi:hypothetical protein